MQANQPGTVPAGVPGWTRGSYACLVPAISNRYHYFQVTQLSTNRNQRMTQQRRIILQELRRIASHPTADEVYSMVRDQLPHVSLGTVYRNLETLAECGEIGKLEISGTQRRFDGSPAAHDHVRCLSCGRVDDLPIGSVTIVQEWSGLEGDYEIHGYRLEFIGLCPACRASDVSRGHGPIK